MKNIGIQKVAEAIRRRRRALGHTQESFAHFAGLARTYYGRIERGEQNIALSTLFALAAHLELPPSELLDGITLEDCDSINSEERDG